MTPETKGQPEPVAYLLPSNHINSASLYRNTSLNVPEGARPLYDYDVPALLEALEKIRRLAGSEPVDVAIETLGRIEFIVEDALAAAREESDG